MNNDFFLFVSTTATVAPATTTTLCISTTSSADNDDDDETSVGSRRHKRCDYDNDDPRRHLDEGKESEIRRATGSEVDHD